ncbi:MAG TPA: thioredoxin domain-containing protein [Steroidobacteraceae bacterium]
MSLTIAVGKDDHVQGPADAPVTLVEYGDYECPYCGAAYPMVKAITKRLGSKVRFVFRNMPLNEMHPHAELAAEAAEAAAAQGKFWEMHDALYEHQSELGPDLVRRLAKSFHLDTARFDADLASGRFRDHVKHDFMSGVRSGVAGTPTFFINGARYDGELDQASLTAALQQVIDAKR